MHTPLSFVWRVFQIKSTIIVLVIHIIDHAILMIIRRIPTDTSCKTWLLITFWCVNCKKIWQKNILRERPFNLKGGGLCFFFKKIFWFPMLLKKIFWFWWRKKKLSVSEFLSYNLMLNSGKNFRTLRDKKNIF
jgi:hypothetical protein